MNRIFLLLLITITLSACKDEPTKETSSQANNITKTEDSNLIKAEYERYYKALENPYPTKCVAEQNKVNPADAAPLDTAFFVFREQLKEIVNEKNIFKFLKHVDENIKVGFEAENGLKQFISNWELDSESKIPHSDLWPTLKTLLSLGGVFNGKGDYFEAPYIDQCYPHDKDAFETGAIIGAGVRMRGGPSTDTKVLKNLSYDVVDFIEETPILMEFAGETHPWIKVKTQDGIEGFVYGKFYRSPIDYRAGFQKNAAGEWKMVRLLAGD